MPPLRFEEQIYFCFLTTETKKTIQDEVSVSDTQVNRKQAAAFFFV